MVLLTESINGSNLNATLTNGSNVMMDFVLQIAGAAMENPTAWMARMKLIVKATKRNQSPQFLVTFSILC